MKGKRVTSIYYINGRQSIGQMTFFKRCNTEHALPVAAEIIQVSKKTSRFVQKRFVHTAVQVVAKSGKFRIIGVRPSAVREKTRKTFGSFC